jgi:SP family general alpha glucoside:H+ symporter-like MFS transporter
MASIEKSEGHVAERVTSTAGHNAADDTKAAINNEHNMSVRQSLRLWWKAILFSFVISLCVVMEGYDTSLMNKFFAFTPFRNRFGDEVDVHGNKLVSSRWQTIILNGTQVRRQYTSPRRMPLTTTRPDAFSVSSSMVTSRSGLGTRKP